MDKEDIKKLSKLHVTNILDLALIVPNKYEDNTIYNHLTHQEQAFEAQILNVAQSPKRVVIKAHLLNVDMMVDLVYFR
ncbi:MAG: ATP-dependent DNA helicase RecG, partial [Epsilonproteobacteria bacterium]|nr:ATP-dependent DNA helicase RecG [Campylobacterota bacterium]